MYLDSFFLWTLQVSAGACLMPCWRGCLTKIGVFTAAFFYGKASVACM